MSSKRTAIGLARQSSSRDDESLSIDDQVTRLGEITAQRGMALMDPVLQEPDVSGRRPLDQRRGLLAAIEAIESGAAQVVVALYFDRLFRSLTVQAEFVDRIERAGGQVLALDTGEVSAKTAGQWLSGTLLGAIAEYHSRTTSERVRAAHAQLVARGVVPFAHNLPCYDADEATGLLVPNDLAPIVVEAYEHRAGGMTIEGVRDWLATKGMVMSYGRTTNLLASRLLVGEIHFGQHINKRADHLRIMDRALWDVVQTKYVPAGRPATKSPLLLARLGVLRCHGCGGPLVSGAGSSGNGKTYAKYRCARNVGDCPAGNRGVSISASVAEDIVVAAVKEKAWDAEGNASMAAQAQRDRVAADAAASALRRAIKLYAAAGLTDDDDAADELARLRAARDDTEERALLSATAAGAMAITLGTDWESLTRDEQRALIQAVVARADVGPAAGRTGRSRSAAAARITIIFAGDE